MYIIKNLLCVADLLFSQVMLASNLRRCGSNAFMSRMIGKNLSNLTEPEYMVSGDGLADPKSIKIPYLREKTKEEMYQLYKNDPKTWTVHSITYMIRVSLINTDFLFERQGS